MTNKNFEKKLLDAINKLVEWIKQNGYYSYDVNDIVASRLGIIIKNIYYKNKYLSAPIIGLLQMIDTFIPQLRKIISKKKRIPLGDANLALGFLNFFKYTNNNTYLKIAEQIIKHLIITSSKTKHGIGWGEPYDWPTKYGVFPKNIPLITTTPYCFEAIYSYARTTEKIHEFRDILKKVADFAYYDLNEKEFEDKSLAASYTPIDKSCILNANAYRASMLIKAYHIFEEPSYKIKALKALRFILNSQNDDGSWYYSSDSKFIDNFHTCFILKNLVDIYEYQSDSGIFESINRGFNFYKSTFMKNNFSLKHYYKSKGYRLLKVELYDYAEAIYLGCRLKKLIPQAFDLSLKLCDEMITNFQLSEGFFITRVIKFNIKHKIPYISWPQAQIFRSMTCLLNSL